MGLTHWTALWPTADRSVVGIVVILVIVGMALRRPWHEPRTALLIGPLNHLHSVCALVSRLADVAAGNRLGMIIWCRVYSPTVNTGHGAAVLAHSYGHMQDLWLEINCTCTV